MTTPTREASEPRLEGGTPCETCGKPVRVGQIVQMYDDVGEVHVDCDAPYVLSDEPGARILAGDPMRLFPVPRLASISPTPAAAHPAVAELIEMLSVAVNEEGRTVFDHTPEEIGLVVMENHRAMLAALGSTPPAVGEGARDEVARIIRDATDFDHPDQGHYLRAADRILATLRPSPDAIREALEQIRDARLGQYEVSDADHRRGFYALQSIARAALATPEGRTTDKGEGK